MQGEGRKACRFCVTDNDDYDVPCRVGNLLTDVGNDLIAESL